MSRRRHTLDVYGTELVLVTTVKKYDRVCGSIADEWTPWHSLGQVQEFLTPSADTTGIPRHALVVCIDTASHEGNPGRLINTIAHEAAHAAGLILDYVGQDYQGVSEAHAHLVGWISQWVWERI